MSEMVYNDNEIKMSMTKERIVRFAMTLIMRFLFFGLPALSDYREKSYCEHGFIHIQKPFDIVQIVQFFYDRLPKPT